MRLLRKRHTVRQGSSNLSLVGQSAEEFSSNPDQRGLKTSQYLVWPPFASRSATHLLFLELIRLLIVACGMLVHSSSMTVWSCWILAGTGTRRIYADPEHPKHAQWVTCSVSMLAMKELGWFQLPGIVYRCLQHGAVLYHAVTWGDGRGWMAQQWASPSHRGISVHSKCHQCP